MAEITQVGTRVRYDEDADAVAVDFEGARPGASVRQVELDDRRIIDYDASGEPISVEAFAVSEGVEVEGFPRPEEVKVALAEAGLVTVQTFDELLQAIQAAEAEGEIEAFPQVGAVAQEQYEANSGKGLRREHALELFESPDQLTTYRHRDLRFLVATRRGPGPKPWVALAIAKPDPRASNRFVVHAGFRLYVDAEDEATRLAGSPSLAFATLLRRYGRTFFNEGRRVRFLPLFTFSIPHPPGAGQIPGWLFDALQLKPEPGSQIGLGAVFRYDRASSEDPLSDDWLASLAWCYVMDLTAYAEDLKRWMA